METCIYGMEEEERGDSIWPAILLLLLLLLLTEPLTSIDVYNTLKVV